MRHIICFGNPLHGDDGFGQAVYERLAQLPLPDGLRLFDAGIAGLAALSLFQNCDEAIIVDALSRGYQPSRVYELLPEDILIETDVSGHGTGVGYLLQVLVALAEPLPIIRIVAAEVMVITPFKPGLSTPLLRSVDDAVELLTRHFISTSYA